MRTTRAEEIATGYVNRMWGELVDGKGAGPSFNVRTFDIVGLVDVNLCHEYVKGRVPAESRRKALGLARRLWDGKIKEMIP